MKFKIIPYNKGFLFFFLKKKKKLQYNTKYKKRIKNWKEYDFLVFFFFYISYYIAINKHTLIYIKYYILIINHITSGLFWYFNQRGWLYYILN